MEEKLKLAVFIDYDNIQIGVKSTLQRDFDVAAVLEALKERGEIVTKIAYANWGRMEGSTRQLSEHAVQMVQRDPSPRGDKNGADINLALDALEMAFTHDHINAFAIVSGDSDFIALVNKLKTYDKRVYVVGGRAFTSNILQKNCHEFVSYESLLDENPRGGRQQNQPRQDKQQPAAGGAAPPPQQQQQGRGRPAPLELTLAMPLVERALQVLERREVRPQLGLLKSTMLQLDSSFSERAYGANSFSDFVEKLRRANLVNLTGSEGRYLIERKGHGPNEKPPIRQEECLPMLRDVLETHRLEVEEGAASSELAEWMGAEHPQFDWKAYGFQEFTELLNYAQDKGVVRIEPNEERGLVIFLGAEFYPPALPEPEVKEDAVPEEEVEEPQPIVPGQPTARTPKPRKNARKTAVAGAEGEAPKRRAPAARKPRKKAPEPSE